MRSIASLRLELAKIALLSGPAVLAQFGMTLMAAVETLMVGQLGATPLCASSLANVWEWTWLCLGQGLVMGMDPLISQAHGRGDGPATGVALQRGIVVALLASVPICLALALTRQGLMFLGQDAEVAELAGHYNLLKMPVVPCFLVFSALKLYLQARTLMVPASVLMWVGNGLHALLSWVLIFGPGACRHMASWERRWRSR